MQKFYRKLDNDKIKINWNKHPIKMELFLSFITVETERPSNFLGSSNGWTKLVGESNLEITGGIIKGVEYLDNIRYGNKLDNPYNNFVNPFYLFEILTDEGKKFFLEYYKKDIDAILEIAQERLLSAKEYKKDLFEFWENCRDMGR